MKDKHVVISLFNGMGCIWIALEKAGIQVSQRISSEVDRHAIKANNSMYPDTIQVGDVRKVEVIKNDIGKPIQLKTENGNIDLMDGEIILGGGSPCQSFSFAGKMKGMSTKDEQQILSLEHYLKLKEQEYEFEGQSYLFWEYMRIKKDLDPKYFLLENVIMVDKWRNVLSRAIGINPIRINAGLVSAQNRDRYFWTNINSQPQGFFGDIECMIPQPKDKGILLKDILEKNVPEKYFLTDKMNKWLDKHSLKRGIEVKKLDGNQKGACLTSSALMKLNLTTDYIEVKDSQSVAMHGRNSANAKDCRAELSTEKMIGPSKDAKKGRLTSATTPTDTTADEKILAREKSQMEKVLDKTGVDISKITEPTILDVYNKKLKDDGKCITLTDPCHNNLRLVVPNKPESEDGYLSGQAGGQSHAMNSRIRRLTPRECGRLQTFPEDKLDVLLKAGVSDSQLYKQFGNGWCVDVIAHIFSYIHKK